MDFLLWALVVSMGINVLMFLPAYVFKTDKLTDISYAVTFIVVSMVAFGRSEQALAHIVLLLMVLAWAVRLGGFLLIRINRMGRDTRFDGMREHFWRFSKFWLLQGVSVFIVLLSSLLLWQEPSASVGVLAWLGLAVFAIGLLLEATADYQKFLFRFSGRKKKQQWIDEGVWRLSRHPNYLGEIMVWIGIYLFVVPSLSGFAAVIGLISPLYITTLLLFVSGIPLLEKKAEKKWGDSQAYKQYKNEVPLLVPTPGSITRSLHKSNS